MKIPLGKLYNALSNEEKEECTSGRWAGIHDASPGATTQMDPKKAKLLKELAAAGV